MNAARRRASVFFDFWLVLDYKTKVRRGLLIMPPALLPLFVLVMVLILLIPPLSLITAVLRRRSHAASLGSASIKLVWFIASLAPLALNLAYLRSIWADLLVGHIETDIMLAMALVVSWTSIWGRVAVRRLCRRRRQFHT